MSENSYSIEHGLEIPVGLTIYPILGSDSNVYISPHSGVTRKVLRCMPMDYASILKVASLYSDVLVQIWSPLSHECIVPLLGVCTNDGLLPAYEIPSYTLGNIVEYNRQCHNANKLHQIMQIAEGLSYMHDNGVTHGNICPANIFIGDDGGVRISDPAVNSLMRRLKYDDTHTPAPHTWCYKPPEELLYGIQSRKADVYSWASVAYEVFSGKRPYQGYHHCRGIFKIVNSGHRELGRPLEISPELSCILQKCWRVSPEDRPTIDQVESELRGL